VAATPNYLTRGMAVNNDYMVAGGSTFAIGSARFISDGCDVIFDKTFKRNNTISMSKLGSITDIRLLGHDYGLSATNLPYCVADYYNSN